MGGGGAFPYFAFGRKADVVCHTLGKVVLQEEINQSSSEGLCQIVGHRECDRCEYDHLNKKILSQQGLLATRPNADILCEDNDNSVSPYDPQGVLKQVGACYLDQTLEHLFISLY